VRVVVLIACVGCNQLFGIEHTRHIDGPPPRPDAVGCSGIELVGPMSVGFNGLDPNYLPLELWFARDNAPTTGYDLYRATRVSTDVPFDPTTIQPVAELNSDRSDSDPALTADGLDIVFASQRLDGFDRLWEATRSDPTQPFGNVHLINELSTIISPYGHDLSYDGLTLVYVDNKYDLRAFQRASLNDPFGPASAVVASNVAWPSVSPDQHELFFEKPVTSGVYRRVRADTSGPFDTAEEAIDASAGDPDISGDATVLVMDNAPQLGLMTRKCP
jgi:hypothetical protein